MWKVITMIAFVLILIAIAPYIIPVMLGLTALVLSAGLITLILSVVVSVFRPSEEDRIKAVQREMQNKNKY